MPLLKCSSSKSTPKKVIAYVTDEKKAAFVSVRNLFEDEDCAKQFTETAAMFGKGKDYDERKYYHFKLSCARKDNVHPQEAQIFAEELTARLFPDCECVIATHTDTQTVHSHIVVNAVHPITGKKLHITESDYGRMKDEANRLGTEMGFSYTEYRKGAKNKRTSEERHIRLKGGTSWKEELREVIEEGIKESKTPDEFKAYLNECYGVQIVRDGKDYSYLHPEKKKPIRGAKLGENYTKTEVLNVISKQNNGTADYPYPEIGNNSRAEEGRSERGNISRSIGEIKREIEQLDRTAKLAHQGIVGEQREIGAEAVRQYVAVQSGTEQTDNSSKDVQGRSKQSVKRNSGRGGK